MNYTKMLCLTIGHRYRHKHIDGVEVLFCRRCEHIAPLPDNYVAGKLL